jgi:hypothetical protein
MARALGQLVAGLSQGLDMEALHRIQDGIGEALVRLNTVGAEAEHERSTRLGEGPDTGPLLRTLLRLRHDLVIIGRAANSPLPQAFGSRLEAPLAQIAEAFAAYLRGAAVALSNGGEAPAFDAVEAALAAYASAVAALRRDGLARDLPGDAAERFFALGFAFEQMRSNFTDLARCVAERAGAARQGKRFGTGKQS